MQEIGAVIDWKGVGQQTGGRCGHRGDQGVKTFVQQEIELAEARALIESQPCIARSWLRDQYGAEAKQLILPRITGTRT